MIYKIVGDTGNGRCACGHRVKRYEEYFVVKEPKVITSLCSKCVKPSTVNTIRVPEDLFEGKLPIH